MHEKDVVEYRMKYSKLEIHDVLHIIAFREWIISFSIFEWNLRADLSPVKSTEFTDEIHLDEIN